MLKKIFLVHHTHMDIGYTDLPLEVMDQHLNHLDEAIHLCRKHKDFFWTIESAYLVRDYIRNRPEKCRAELFRLLQEKRIELQAFETQPLTELLAADDLSRCVEYACNLGKEHGFAVKSSMINDIGGYAGRMPTILALHGVRYLVAGVGAFQAHLPWANLPHLFYLQAKDGARTLVWNLGIDRTTKNGRHTAVYGIGDENLINPAFREYLGIDQRGVELDLNKEGHRINSVELGMTELLARLKRENYPYEEVMLQDGGDNRGPSKDLPAVIEKLNSLGKFPEIQLLTPTCFFEYMEDKYGNAIPELQGVIADPWNMRANPAPVPLKKYRAAQRVYHSALAKLALTPVKPTEPVEEKCRIIEENLQLYGDHTCGLSEWEWQEKFDSDACRGISYDRYRESWKKKAFYADAACDGAVRIDRMVRKNLAPGLAGNKPAVIVWNNSSVETSGTAELYLGRDALAVKSLKDKSGTGVPFQKIGLNRYLLELKNIPPFGAEVLNVDFDGAALEEATENGGGIPESFENDFLELQFSPVNGDIISFVDKNSGKEVTDKECRWKFGSFVYQLFEDISFLGVQAGMAPSEKINYPEQKITGAEVIYNGSVALKIRQKGEIATSTEAGTIRFERDLVLYHNFPRIDVQIRINKPDNAHKESCYVAFPFAGKNGSFKFDQNLGIVDPKKDLLPGSMQDLFYCNRFASVSENGFNALVCCPDAPVVHFGAINAVQWVQKYPFETDSNHIYAQIYHNLLNTDCPIWQDILETFNYQIFIRPGKFDHAAAQKDWSGATSLAAEYCSGNLEAESIPLDTLEVLPEQIRLLSFRKAGEKYHIMLENTDSKTVAAKITHKNKIRTFSIEAFGFLTAEI